MLPASVHTRIHIKLLQDGLREYFKQQSETRSTDMRSEQRYSPPPADYNPALEWRQ